MTILSTVKKRFPVFVPLSEIELRANTFTDTNRDRLITLIPKNGVVLHGFRCTEQDEWKADFESCGTIEPMPWLCKMYCRAYYRKGMTTIAARFPLGFTGVMDATPIACIALAPQESGGYQIIGSNKTTIRFISGRVVLDDPDDIVGFELGNYSPLPMMYCFPKIEVEDCTQKELIEKLNELIINGTK